MTGAGALCMDLTNILIVALAGCDKGLDKRWGPGGGRLTVKFSSCLHVALKVLWTNLGKKEEEPIEQDVMG